MNTWHINNINFEFNIAGGGGEKIRFTSLHNFFL